MAFTRILGPGIHTASNINSHNINSTGIITASAFKGGGQIGINTVGGTLGYGVSILNFIGSGISTTLVDNTLGIATIDVSGGGGGSFAPVNYIIG